MVEKYKAGTHASRGRLSYKLGMRMKALIIGMVLLFVCTIEAEDDILDIGSICVAPLPENVREQDSDFPSGRARREFKYEFSAQVDSLDRVNVPFDDPVLIDSLELEHRHLVIIRDGDTIIESFWFTFKAQGGPKLCLSYTPWYQTWSLTPPYNRPWCQCNKQ